jgi:hypothetical protein
MLCCVRVGHVIVSRGGAKNSPKIISKLLCNIIRIKQIIAMIIFNRNYTISTLTFLNSIVKEGCVRLASLNVFLLAAYKIQ